MSLRTRLFLIVGGLVLLLVGAQWALVTALTEDLEEEAGDVALQVGSDVLGTLFPRAAVGFVPQMSGSRFFVYALPGAGVGVAESAESEDVEELEDRRGLARTVRYHERWRTDARPTAEGGVERTGERHQVLRMVMMVPGRGEGGGVWVDHHEELSAIVKLELAETAHLIDLHDTAFHWAGERGHGQAGAHPVGSRGRVAPEQVLVQQDAPDGEPIAHEIPIPQGGFQEAVAGFLQSLWLGSLGILGLGLVVGGWVAHRVTVPLRRLSSAAREVGEGALGTQIVAGGDREVAGTIAAFNHMSVRLRALDGEARALREREHLTEIGEVARGLAHALRNPLHLLGLTVDQLAARCPAGDERSAELSAAARGQIRRVDRSLRSFLSLSSGSAAALEDVRVDDLARDVALELLQDEGGTHVRVEAGGPCAVRGVAPELRAVLHVLVVNAVEAGPGGGEVVVRVQCGDGEARIEVEDEGPGIPPEVRERLFTPHLTTKPQGAGMGLFLARRIATSRYGGTLELEPRGEPGERGTRAVLEIRDRKGELGV